MFPHLTPAVTDLGVSNIPHSVFVLIHVAALAIGAFFASRAFRAGNQPAFAWGFTLYAIGEVIYILYHVGTTTFLLSHTIAEVLDLVAFILVFVGVAELLMDATPAAAKQAEAPTPTRKG